LPFRDHATTIRLGTDGSFGKQKASEYRTQGVLNHIYCGHIAYRSAEPRPQRGGLVVTNTTGRRATGVEAPRVFDCTAFFDALDDERRARGLEWSELATDLYEQSYALNAQLLDHAICPGAVVRIYRRGTISCQYALFMLRWLGRAPEEFLIGRAADLGDVRLPQAGPESRLRWNLNEVHAALDAARNERGLSWARLAQTIDCTPSRLTNLRTARLADMDLVMRITQWLGRPAAAFIHPAGW
jgi:hypothetical protein